ncbi:hypothetical protein K505DRAFT_283589 [Melanomma pulvis-pyrius CBS 109.77]|uniref:Uncharacterized protein n=1 Tax=Melanomma pulvis-pyrius CBS 109.77 TaxID=1314802 RepID=A0A6A6X0N0_9PLEO|nr:hypothetical protein K505DRAFT_283589 [Melanomma pulvis-pyrius CBS 109.77]
MSAINQTIAFFGATGGTAAAALAASLRAGYTCTALARTPDKLRDLLKTGHCIPESTISSQLTIHPGNVKDPVAVATVLISPLDPSVLVDYIISGIGGAPKLQWTPPFAVLDDPVICESATASILAAISQLETKGISAAQDGRKPLITVISTTGISDRARDVPYLLLPIYYGLLHVPHVDKRKMEALLFNDKGVHVRDFVVVRPTLLMDYQPCGIETVKAGWEWGVKTGEEPGPALGYTVGRKDVGEWVFQEVIQKGGWEGKCVSLCYH